MRFVLVASPLCLTGIFELVTARTVAKVTVEIDADGATPKAFEIPGQHGLIESHVQTTLISPISNEYDQYPMQMDREKDTNPGDDLRVTLEGVPTNGVACPGGLNITKIYINYAIAQIFGDASINVAVRCPWTQPGTPTSEKCNCKSIETNQPYYPKYYGNAEALFFEGGARITTGLQAFPLYSFKRQGNDWPQNQYGCSEHPASSKNPGKQRVVIRKVGTTYQYKGVMEHPDNSNTFRLCPPRA